MIRLISILLPIIFLMTGCRYVSIHVIPDGADITVRQKTLRTPTDIYVTPLWPVTATISAKGYAPMETTISYSTPSPLDIVLQKQFKVTSKPSDADVFLNGAHIGHTPVEFTLPANEEKADLSIRKNTFKNKDLQFSPASSGAVISAYLEPENPGLLYWTVKPATYGRIRLVSSYLRAESSSNEPGNKQPVSIVQLTDDKQKQILGFTLLPEGDGILASVLIHTPENNKKFEARLIHYPLVQADQNQVIITKQNIDLTPTFINKNNILYASTKTGRLDLWKCRLLPYESKQQDLDLVLSSDLIIFNPQIRSDGHSVLATVYQPDKLTAPPQIWSFTLDGVRNIIPEFFCNGECPAWSPNGRRIAFQEGNPSAIYKIDSDGSLKEQLSPKNSPASFKQPAWSPDGKHNAFAANINAPQSQ